MSRETVTLQYDGPALANRQMDVAYLAPALYALNDLCKIANSTFNGERASVRVLVNVDREQNSFVFDIEIVTSLLEQARALLDDPRVQDAKDIAEILGLIYGGSKVTVAAGAGFFGLLKWLRGRTPEFEATKDQHGRDVFHVYVPGDNNHITIAPETKTLYEDRNARKDAKRVLEPLEDEGYERLEFLNRGEVTEFFDKDEAKDVLKMPDAPPGSGDADEPQVIKAWLRVYAPVFDESAARWRFQWGDLRIYADISETNIAADAIRRGGVNIGDSYHVLLEIAQVEQDAGNFTNRYKIKEVLEFRRGLTQETMRFEDPENPEGIEA